MMIFLNASTMVVDAEALKPEGMPDDMLAYVEAACRVGKACDVSKQMIAIMDYNTECNPRLRDCFLLPSEPTDRVGSVRVRN